MSQCVPFLSRIRFSFLLVSVVGLNAESSREQLESTQIASLLSNFKASDPQYQEWCAAVVNGSASSANKQQAPATPGRTASQFFQDVFIWRNLFIQKALRGEKGFYVDSGANHWFSLSNTFFFDKCLGWSGLCVEPTREYWDDLKAHRSCTLVTDCISNSNKTAFMSSASVNSRLDSTFRRHSVTCHPLRYMLDRVGQRNVDFWSLDIEGHESTVMHQFDPSEVDVSVILVEDGLHDPRAFDFLFNTKGFVKFHQLSNDAVYVSRSALNLRPSEVWQPKDLELRNKEDFRNLERAWACNMQALDAARQTCVCKKGFTRANDKRCRHHHSKAKAP